jgi:crossover junction endodeoxyribonuclease RuvC
LYNAFMSSAKKQKILGIDPGYGRIGYGLIEGSGNKWSLVDYGCIHTDPKKTISERLLDIEKMLVALVKQHKPTIGAVEELFFVKNVSTGINVAQARGVIVLTLQKAGMPIYEYTPTQIKQAITGNGRASKANVQEMTKILLKVNKKLKQDDAVDALGVALTCASAYTFESKTR